MIAERGVARFARTADGSWRWWDTPFVRVKGYARSVWAASPTRAFLVVKSSEAVRLCPPQSRNVARVATAPPVQRNRMKYTPAGAI